MAISFDATANVVASYPTAFSWTQTIMGNFLVVSVLLTSSTGSNDTASVTCNGVNLTQLYDLPESNPYAFMGLSVWYLVNPPTGLQTIFVTPTHSLSGDPSAVNASSASFFGVDQVNPIDNSGTTVTFVQNETNPSVNLTTVNDQAWIVDALINYTSSNTWTPNFPQVATYNVPAQTGVYLFTSYQGPVSPAGITSDGWTTNYNLFMYNGLLFAFSIKPAGPTSTATAINFNTVLVQN